MAPKSCKKPVYATMCETEDGIRTGKYRGNRYESHRKKTATKSTKTKTVRKTPATMKKEKAPKIVYDPDTAYDMAADRRLDDLEAQDFMVNRNRLNYGRKDPEELRLQTMHLQDAWMKRQASKRKKYGTAARAKTLAMPRVSYSSTKPLKYGAWDPEQSKIVNSLPYIADEWVRVDLSSQRFKMPAGKDVRNMGQTVGFKKWSWWYYPKNHSRLVVIITYDGNEDYWKASIGGHTMAATPYDAVSINTSKRATLSTVINEVDKWIGKIDRTLSAEQKRKWIA